MLQGKNDKVLVRGSRRNLLIIASVAIFVVGGMILTWSKSFNELKGNMNLIIPGSMDMARTKNMEPIDIHLLGAITGDGVHLRIPKSYMTNKRNWAGGEQTESVKIETRLPELQPAKALYRAKGDEGSAEYEAGLKKRQNGVFVTIKPGVIRDDTKRSFEDNNYRWYQRKYLLQTEEKFGLEHFYEQSCKTETDQSGKESERCWFLIDEYFVAKHEDKKKWKFFWCSRPEMNPGAACRVNTRFRNIRLQYMFRRSQLHRWQEFDIGVTKLLDQFYIGEVKKDNNENFDKRSN